MTYYDDLVKDKQRVETFKKVIQKKTHKIAYDLGTGSGILATFASEYANKVYAVEFNPLITKKTKKSLDKYTNIIFMDADATKVEMPEMADTVICEMLDTALIDEQQVPVLNHVQKYTKKDTIFIPEAVYSTVQLVYTNIMGISYYEDEHPQYTIASDEIKYDTIFFNHNIKEDVYYEIKVRANSNMTVNALKITTYTILDENTILAPTPMLNPPLIIPVDKLQVDVDDIILIKLEYKMGGGLDSIKATIRTD